MSITVPGLVDIQVNGGFGHDFTSDPASIWEVGRRLPEHGVTAFVPTIISSSPSVALAAFAALAAGPPIGWKGARPLGIHLEGPMISSRRRGAHPDDLLVKPSLQLAESWRSAGPPLMVTLAPELTGAEAVIAALRQAGTVVSLGHSDCTVTEARESIDWGAAHVTHLFNAMSGLDHRRPGLAAAALTHNTVTVGLIADGIHVDPVMVDLAFRTLGPDRIALVTDAVAALGIGAGRYRLGGTEVDVNGLVASDANGTLAGGLTPMNVLLRTVIEATGCSVDEALTMASTTPARVVGYSPRPGDQVTLDDDMAVVATTIAGELVYRR